MEANYDYNRDLIPSVAPVRILRRFHSRHLMRIW
jgi:hypothetical protein